VKKEKKIGIYKITSPSGKIYIGQSVDCEKRFSQYKKLHSTNQTFLYNSLKKHGSENHNFEIIHLCLKEELNQLECHYISFFDTFNTLHGLNLTSGGDAPEMVSDETRKKISESIKGEKNGFYGKKHTEETKEKIRKIHIGNKYALGVVRSEEYKLKSSLSRIGKKSSEETKKKISMSNTGKPGTFAFLGKKHSPETIAKMKLVHSGKKYALGTKRTEEHKRLKSEMFRGENNPNFGKKASLETRKKISEAHKGEKHYAFGKKRSDEFKKKCSESQKGEKSAWYGKKHSEETKEKMRINNSQKGKKLTEEQKQNLREKAKIRWSNPEERARMSQITKNYNQKKQNEKSIFTNS
jgi:group I intron endonuclease